MDGNKDEALKCMKIAQTAMESNDRTRALKFINKARRLDPSLSLNDLLSKLDTQSESTEPTTEIPPESTTGPRRRVSTTGSSSSTGSVGYTEEQVTIVREIRKKKDYYEVLGLEKSCSGDDIRKAYRKLSLKVHPDKNKAPESEDAFKAVSKAFQCLSDEESRKKYDVVGHDEPIYERRGPRGGREVNGFYEGEFDADEIFRNFFFGGMNPGTTGQFGVFSFGNGMGGARVRVGDNHGSNGKFRALIQLLPVILILLMNFLPSSEPVYSLYGSYPYEHRVTTTQKGVDFYVKSGKFEQEYPYNSQQRVVLEQSIERDYYSVLAHNCRLELQRLQWGWNRETPYCDAMKKFETAA